jgi:CBS domain-containing protein
LTVFFCVRRSSDALFSLQHFGLGVHRVFVTQVDGKPLSVLTQSDVLAWAMQRPEERLRDATLPAEAIMTRREEVLAVRDTQAAIDAFCAIESKHCVGAPVLDENGGLVGSLSTSDLKQARLCCLCFPRNLSLTILGS